MIRIKDIEKARDAYRRMSGKYPNVMACSRHDKRELAILKARRSFPPKPTLITQLRQHELDMDEYFLSLFHMEVVARDLPVGSFDLGVRESGN